MNIRVSIALTLLFCPAIAKAGEIDEIRTLWKGEQYSSCIERLISYRQEPFGRTVEVDYMLGTSFCRDGEHEEYGRAFLKNALEFYPLSDANREIIESELEMCPPQDDPVELAYLTNRASAGSGVRGKMFYVLTGTASETASMGVNQIEAVNPIPSAILEGRKISRETERPSVIEQFETQRLLKKIFHRSGEFHVSEHFVIESQGHQSAEQLDFIATTLERALSHFVNEFGMRAPENYITVYLLTGTYDLSKFAEKAHGLNLGHETIGYSVADDLSLSAVTHGTSTGTLKHELGHLLLRRDFGDAPPWLDEGLAALYEESRQQGDQLVGLQNWRGEVLKRFWNPTDVWANRELLETDVSGVEDILAMSWSRFDENGGAGIHQLLNHAFARYLVLYLQETGKLQTVYKVYQNRDPRSLIGNPSNEMQKRFEEATGFAIDGSFNESFKAWFDEFTRPMSNEEIEELQRGLAALGYNPGEPDGQFGQKTAKAIRAFQTDRGWSPTGVPDRGMLGLMVAD